MKLCSKSIFFFIFIFKISLLHGTDIHFSNYTFSDAYLNPALPSLINEDIRANIKYRSQWETIANGFQTVAAQFDINPLNISTRFCGKKLVITPQIIYDRAGSLRKSTTAVNLNLSYSQFLDRQYKTQIAIGLQGGYTFSSIDLSKATFGSDYLNSGGSLSLNDIVPNQHYPNLSLGATMAFYPTSSFNFSGGLAAYNILKPNVSFIENNEVLLSRRYTAFLNFNNQINEIHSINSYLLFQYQNPFTYYQGGVTWQANIGKKERDIFQHQLFAGLGLRWKDAIISSIGYHHTNYTIALNYDFNYSKLISSSRGVGAFELSFAFATDWFKTNKNCPRPIPCVKLR